MYPVLKRMVFIYLPICLLILYLFKDYNVETGSLEEMIRQSLLGTILVMVMSGCILAEVVYDWFFRSKKQK